MSYCFSCQVGIYLPQFQHFSKQSLQFFFVYFSGYSSRLLSINQFNKSDAACQKFYGLYKFLNIFQNFYPISCPVLSSSVNPDKSYSNAFPRLPIPISPPSPPSFSPLCISFINFSYQSFIFFIVYKSYASYSPSALSSLVKFKLPYSNSFISLSISSSMPSAGFQGSCFSGSGCPDCFYFYQLFI